MADEARASWTPMVVVGMAQMQLALNVDALAVPIGGMVERAPKSLAGDVGALRGTVNNLGRGVGTAFAGALAVRLLAASIERGMAAAPSIPDTLAERVNLDEVTFLDNSQVKEVPSRKALSANQAQAALEINAQARLSALRLSLLILGALGLFMVIAGRFS